MICIYLGEQFLLNRIANAAIDIYSMVVVLSRATQALNINAPSASYEEKLTNIICFEVRHFVFIYVSHLFALKKKKKINFSLCK